ncbi:phosphoribosylformylglycinamidine synthase subunit PurQ [Companilactobacillus metriopterae]|uniref:phosphoribosylformylglycinamidine synthase subunit PurQ n=1 Tax=Companilactobacillus metriopterae TaxID=1909267 RepID=UPI00100BEBAA|nr:phosphoribosylformylglycinamidine synthase subunit PurQ [Companilactobacillus metriopterae]
MKLAVIVFPGSNCDKDLYHALKITTNHNIEFVNSDEPNLEGFDGVFIPGGFSYGDYLRSGALAAKTPITKAIKRLADQGKPVLGICNGFQILTEMNLLPGSLIKNDSGKFICDTPTLIVKNNQTMFSNEYKENQEIRLPIAHGEGEFYCDLSTLKNLRENNQIILQYSDDVNGSIDKIAGITNIKGNVMGLMPHPERAIEEILGSKDGIKLFKSIFKSSEVNQ